MAERTALSKEVGRRLERIRHTLKLTRKEAARHLGVHMAQVQRIEKGMNSPSIDTLVKICDGYGVHPWKLLRPEPSETDENEKETNLS